MASAVDPAECELAAIRAYLRGADDDSARQWEAAHRAALAVGDPAESARFAFWLGLGLAMRGQAAPASAWFTRAEELIEQTGAECAASGYLFIPRCLAALDTGDPASAKDLALAALAVGRRYADADLCAFATLAHGQALIALGETAAGVGRLDEVMVSVSAEELSPITKGIVYCAVILECMGLYDLRRASEWTTAMAAWCDARPDLVPFRGQCLVHRSQLELAAGAWPEAAESAQSACRRLTDPPHPALGLAHYQTGELHRLRGDFDEAMRSYRHAGRHGYHPMPGLALLELARGDGAAAVISIRRVLPERGAGSRPALLAAAVEIFRENCDFEAARAAAEELREISDHSGSAVLRATSSQATGSVMLATGDVTAALVELQSAARTWRELRMPYQAALVAVQLGVALAMLGDKSAADLEFESAQEVFDELGAAPDLARLAESSHASPASCGLSAREIEVLVHLTAGHTNRQIAAELVLSPRTVAHHVEHIYAKLGVANRAAAAAYAHEHHLV